MRSYLLGNFSLFCIFSCAWSRVSLIENYSLLLLFVACVIISCVCSAPTGTRNNLQGTRSCARICKIAILTGGYFRVYWLSSGKKESFSEDFKQSFTQSAHSVRVGEHVSTTKTIHSTSILRHADIRKNRIRIKVLIPQLYPDAPKSYWEIYLIKLRYNK